jgi:hypothetical protein
LDATDYQLASAISGERVGNRFENVGFNPGSVDIQAGIPVNYNFTIPAYYDGMEVNVTLDGLAPADDETRLKTPADGRSAIKSYIFRPTGAGAQTLKLKTQNKEESICYVTLEAENYYYETETTPLYQSAVRYSFEEAYFDGRPQSITANTDVKVIFNIPAEAFINGMIVNVTLDGFGPNDNKLNDAGNGTYTYTVTQSGQQEFRVKASGKEARTCYVTLESINNKFITETIEVEQTVSHALKITNVNSLNDSWRAQARYTFSEPLQNSTHTFKCWIKSSARNQITLYVQNSGNNSQSNSHTIRNIGSGWTEVEIKVSPGANNRNSIVFNIADVAGDVYIDQVSFIRDNDQNKTELMQNNDMDDYELIDGRKVPTGWDTKTNDSNNTNPVCYVEQVEGGHE